MKLLSVNVSLVKEIAWGDKRVTTGIFKEPVAGRVAAGFLGLDGDAQADQRYHGGRDKAVYAFPFENYAHWQRELGRRDLGYGQFGENLTIEGILETDVHVGDAFRIGSAVFEISQPRAPCFKLGIKMDDPQFPKQFLASCHVGFYLRVLEEGEVGAGDAIEAVRIDPSAMTIRDMTYLRFFDCDNREGVERALGMPALSAAWRQSFEERLAKAGVNTEPRNTTT